MSKNLEEKEKVKTAVRENYAKVAKNEAGCGCNAGCCSEPLEGGQISEELGYSQEDLKNIPKGANMGLGCGNPTAFSKLKKNEIVLDLGSGGGIDCFIAAKEVGACGRVIGVDMTSEMVSKARLNAKNGGYENVEFRLGEIEYLPVADSSVDVIISNCVINLSPDKLQVFKEAFRVLKSGGRLAVSDIVKTSDLPEEINNKIEAYTGCVSGASTLSEIEKYLIKAGFINIQFTPKDQSRDFIKNWIPGSRAEDYVQSAIIEAIKP